jgi:hypothetical protein
MQTRIGTAASITVLLLIAVSSVLIICPDLTGYELKVIVTDSMDGEATDYPIRSIPRNSLVVIDGSPPVIRVGDVVGYRTPLMEGTVHHRVVFMGDGYFIVKGDNLDIEETVLPGDVTGKVVLADHISGQIIVFMRSNLIALALILLGAYLLATDQSSPGGGYGGDIE